MEKENFRQFHDIEKLLPFLANGNILLLYLVLLLYQKGKKRQYNLTFIPRRAFLHQKGNKKDSNKCQCSNLEEGLNVRKCLSPLIRFQWKNSGQANSAFGIVFISPLKPFYPSTLFTFFTEVVSQDWFPLYLFSLCIQFHIITHHNRLQYIDSDLGGVNFFKWFIRGNYITGPSDGSSRLSR